MLLKCGKKIADCMERLKALTELKFTPSVIPRKPEWWGHIPPWRPRDFSSIRLLATIPANVRQTDRQSVCLQSAVAV